LRSSLFSINELRFGSPFSVSRSIVAVFARAVTAGDRLVPSKALASRGRFPYGTGMRHFP
jgi:hypothetical protein